MLVNTTLNPRRLGMFNVQRADDAKLFRHIIHDSDKTALQKGVNALQEWTQEWFLKLNNLPDEASPGDWLGLRSQADLNSPINDSSLCSLSK